MTKVYFVRHAQPEHDHADDAGKNIVIGTYGTALSSILNYYDPKFGCADFLRMIDWIFRGKERADKKA